MNERILRDVLRRLDELERTSLHLRRGVIDTVSPLAVRMGGAEAAYSGVKGLADAQAGEAVLALAGRNDVYLLGREGPDPWHVVGAVGEPTFQNTWVNFNSVGFGLASAFRRLHDGLVVIRGLVKRTSGTFPSTIFALPAGYRPSEHLIFATASNNAFARLNVLSDGTVSAETGSNTWFSINCAFYADQ